MGGLPRTQIFKDATLFFSRDTPNLATVIPAMEHMSNMLDGCIRDEVKYEEPIRIALSLAKRTLTKYYNLTDAADTYRIAMGMTPPACLYTKSVLIPSPISTSPTLQDCLLQAAQLDTSIY